MEEYLPSGVVSQFIAALLGIGLVVVWRLVNKYLPPPPPGSPGVAESIAEAKAAADQATKPRNPDEVDGD